MVREFPATLSALIKMTILNILRGQISKFFPVGPNLGGSNLESRAVVIVFFEVEVGPLLRHNPQILRYLLIPWTLNYFSGVSKSMLEKVREKWAIPKILHNPPWTTIL